MGLLYKKRFVFFESSQSGSFYTTKLLFLLEILREKDKTIPGMVGGGVGNTCVKRSKTLVSLRAVDQ